MGNSSGVGGSQPVEPTGTPPGGPEGGSIEKALHTKVRTLGELKQVLIDNLGEKEGKKLYDSFMKSLMMQIVTQMQESASSAKKASQSMRSSGPQ